MGLTKEIMKKLYIIGNGFDIHHGLKTRYSDYKWSTMQERLKLPGMRWDVTTAQYVLSAKMKYDSGLWDSYVVPLVYSKLRL